MRRKLGMTSQDDTILFTWSAAATSLKFNSKSFVRISPEWGKDLFVLYSDYFWLPKNDGSINL